MTYVTRSYRQVSERGNELLCRAEKRSQAVLKPGLRWNDRLRWASHLCF
jgi:hypothetical protein